MKLSANLVYMDRELSSSAMTFVILSKTFDSHKYVVVYKKGKSTRIKECNFF